MITVDIGQVLRLVNGDHSGFLRSSFPEHTPKEEERATESSDENNGNGNSGYSSCTNTVGATTGGFDNSDTTRGWIGACGTSGVDMRYGHNMTWRRCVESGL